MTRPPQPVAHPPASRAMAVRVCALLLILFGFALRLQHLGSESLWYDETVSAYLAGQSIPELVAHTARDIHPPAYYLLLHAWRALAHPTVAFGLEYLYAWPSFLLAVLGLALTFAIARRCFGTYTALFALALSLLQPVQVWYAQEVRMYALGACCVLLTLWAVTPALVPHMAADLPMRWPRASLWLYPLAALLGLYTLYYFAFWLIALNLALLLRLWQVRRALVTWLALQLVVITGWLPWLPIFLHQALDPPVPPWRVPWQSAGELFAALSEALSALWFGNAAPITVIWPLALAIAAGAVLFYVYAKEPARSARWAWLILTYLPALMLLAITLIGPPIYHVRYVSTYAPLYPLLLAALLRPLRRGWAVTALVVIFSVSTLAIIQLWTSPQHAADDHRAAVAALASAWRPGDAILVNAGWVYPALAVYWPDELPDAGATRPPALAAMPRLSPGALDTTLPRTPIAFRTGSVDAHGDLGWNLPESDFFAISTADTLEALAALARSHARIWHYRLYDTVSDPAGVIRQWLTDHSSLDYAQAIPGRDFLRLEAFRTGSQDDVSFAPRAALHFEDAGVTLTGVRVAETEAAGEMLYVDLQWLARQPLSAGSVGVSLRLLDAAGHVIAQQDTDLESHTAGTSVQRLALPIPADTIPGDYAVTSVVYARQTLAPYAATNDTGETLPPNPSLATVHVTLPNLIPTVTNVAATFDYIDLVRATLPATPVERGASFDTAWVWRPRASRYRDQYQASLSLETQSNAPIPLVQFDLGGAAYLSSTWPPGYPLKQIVSLTLPPDLSAGTYKVLLTVTRASDAQVIPGRARTQLWPQPAVVVGTLQIGASK